VVHDESTSDMQSRKSNMLIAIKPAIVWDWPAMPGYDYKPVAQIATETKMVLLDDISTKWYYKVELPDGKVGYICSYLVRCLDKEPKKTVQKAETIEECTEYINYLVDRHEEKKGEKKAAAKPKTQVKKKPIAKKAAAKKQPAKSSGTHTVKPQAQPEVRFMDEPPVSHSSPPPSLHEKSVHTGTGGEKH
ncbi:MAG: SH3 domain-containing protein, partial [Candidatus Desantisbacteria bacterium]